MDQPRKPNFFIVGGPKCGTTALYEYLRSHPSIFFASPKEPDFFTSYPYPRYRRADTMDEYLSLFRRAKDHHVAVGEASVGYLYEKKAITRLHEFNPGARIIALVRNPVDMVYSWHAQLVYNCEEPERDFRKAWDLQSERAAGKNIPEKCRDYRLLLYAEFCKFGKQIEHLFATFPREQVLVIVVDDMRADTKKVYEDTLAFLGVESDGRTEFSRINVAKTVGDGWWGRFSGRPPDWWIRGSHFLKKTFNIADFHILLNLREKFAKKQKQPPLQVLSEAEPGIDWETRIAKFDMYGYGLFLGPLSEMERVRSTLPRRRVRLPSGQIVERPVGPAIPDLRFRSRTKGL